MKRFGKKGFTLVEMMVVVAILGILMAIAIPVYSSVLEGSNRRTVEANHNMIVSAIDMYVASHNGAYPTAPNDLNPFLQNSKGDAAGSVAALQDDPKGATYTLTCADSKTRPSLISKFKGKALAYNATVGSGEEWS